MLARIMTCTNLLRFACLLALSSSLWAGCGDPGGSDGPAPADLSVASDLTVIDLAQPDLSHPDLLPAPDLYQPDMALPIEWTARNSGTTKFLHSIWGAAANDVFVVGESGTILHSTDGKAWAAQTSGTQVNLNGVWGTSSKDVYVAGDAGTLLHYDGVAWSALQSGVKVTLRGLGGTGPMDVWAVGDAGTILNSTDGGKSWMAIPPLNPPVLTALRQVLVLGQTVWAAGDAGNLIIHTDHFGMWQWILRNISSPENVYGLCVVSTNPLSLWTAADDGSLRYSFDGLIWPRQNGAPLTPMRAIWGSSSDDVYGVGDGGIIYHLAKLHTSFAPQGSGTKVRLDAVWGSGPTDVYAVGEAGTIIHRP